MIKKAVCAECGKAFEYTVKGRHKIYCCEKCYREAKRRLSKERYKNNREQLLYKANERYAIISGKSAPPPPPASPTKRNEQVEDFERQARTQGLSYGQLQALKRLEAEHGS